MTYGLIGCGMISPNHIKAALDNGLEIVALCDVVEENRQKALALIPEEQRACVRLYADHREMLDELHPQLVAIALGSGQKKRLACDCMAAGSSVIVEKPIALSLAEADEMIAAAGKYGVKLCVNHQLRFGKTVRAVWKQAREGRFGRLLYGTVQVRRNRNKAYFDAAKWRGTWAQDGGTLMNQCIHYTDLLQWFMGSPVTEVFAYTDNCLHPYTEAEDMGLGLVRFANGAYGLIEGSIDTYPKNLSDGMSLFGENGCVVLDDKSLENVQAWRFAAGPQSRDEALAAYGIEDMGSGHTPLYADMKAALEQGREPLCSGAEGRRALELVLAFYKSAAEGKPVQLPLTGCATTDFIGRFDHE